MRDSHVVGPLCASVGRRAASPSWYPSLPHRGTYGASPHHWHHPTV